MTRQCGDCTLCCKLLPVRAVGKKDNERCKHQSHARGCKVYADLGRVSPECRLWSCRWLVNDDADDLARPDRSRYVIDIMPDFVTSHDNSTGETTDVPVVQVWVDPKYPDAHKDPALRAWIERHRSLALIRYSASDAFVLAPPSTNYDGRWAEIRTNSAGRNHSPAELMRVLASYQT